MSADRIKQIEFLARALKAPRIRDFASRLADQARDAGWTHEEYKAAHAGHRVLFGTAVEWVARLQDAHHRGRLPGEIVRLRRFVSAAMTSCP